ncbi:MAG: DegV family EDD domain-containing protein [Candidatus Aminicenantes bacterium]|nr:DegV family EDD domain-containing protein [Candidatus Aminicenantes bacterium]
MKIRYLDGRRLHAAFLAGGEAVIQDRETLNRINVFPVPDADTGNNLASTMRSISLTTKPGRTLRETLRSIADAALMGARGNSGLIFAQFVQGISREAPDEPSFTTRSFGELAPRAVRHVQSSILNPVEGTMLTVMRDWAESLFHFRTRTSDFSELIHHSLEVARRSLRDTPKKLQVLARARVVDAGAKGFVDFVEGIHDFIRSGRLRRLVREAGETDAAPAKVHSFKEKADRRYCAEAILTGDGLDLERIRERLRAYGGSAIVAGSEEKARFHVHTDRPAELFFEMKDLGALGQVKVDDMKRQFQAAHARRSGTALVTDSACDLPPGFLEEHQVHLLPFTLSFGDTHFLDKLTITPEHFYRLLLSRPEHPTTSLPSPALARETLSFLAEHYDSVLVFSVSSGLSGSFEAVSKAAAEAGRGKARVVDTRTLSAAQGLIVMRAAEAAAAGAAAEDIARLAEEWRGRTRILVDVQTLRYMVRGGRVSPLKGLAARLLNLKPIVTLDENGKAAAWGKSFGRRANMDKIIRAAAEAAAGGTLWRYAVVHALNRPRAEEYARRLTGLLGRPPAFIQDIAPVIGVHNGIGAVAVCLMLE